MSDDLEFIVIDDIPEYIFCIGDDEENERVIALSGKDGAFKYEKVAELPTAGEDGVLYLVPKSHTTQTASGNPINVNITDGAGKIESLKLDGDTSQQTYEGKNLLNPFAQHSAGWTTSSAGIDYTLQNDGSVYCEGQATAASHVNIFGEWSNNSPVYIQIDTSKTYTVKLYGAPDGWIGILKDGAREYKRINNPTTITGAEGITLARLDFANGQSSNLAANIQVEAGSTATSFEPFVGGAPSPNPDYPQTVQTVTGTQTISINGTDYPIDLGSIELCKLSTYQDYIYKDGDDWKVHKTIGHDTRDVLVNGISNFASGETTISAQGAFAIIGGTGERWHDYDATLANARLSCNLGTYLAQQVSGNQEAESMTNGTFCQRSGYNDRLYFRDTAYIGKTGNDVKAILLAKSGGANAWWFLSTPTDTTITDTTLIAQLEAIRTAALETGTNTISNTATGTNLAGDLELGYYGYDPLNKYDKYFWLDIDGGYESI